MQVTRKIIEIDEELCNGCGKCIVDCAEAALEIVGGKARLIGDKYCDGLGACMGACPTGALRLVERGAEEFDEEAVEKMLKEKKDKGGCPSAAIQNLQGETPCQKANKPAGLGLAGASNLSHWPIQIRLVPASAPFLQNADLLIAADCTTVAAANFHSEFLKDRVVMMGCPKFDDAEGYAAKFTEIFSTVTLNSLTILIMEVPCCQSMRNIVKEAMRRANKTIPAEVLTISARGEVINRVKLDAEGR